MKALTCIFIKTITRVWNGSLLDMTFVYFLTIFSFLSRHVCAFFFSLDMYKHPCKTYIWSVFIFFRKYWSAIYIYIIESFLFITETVIDIYFLTLTLRWWSPYGNLINRFLATTLTDTFYIDLYWMQWFSIPCSLLWSCSSFKMKNRLFFNHFNMPIWIIIFKNWYICKRQTL